MNIRFLSTLSPIAKGMLLSLTGYTGFAFSDISVKLLANDLEIMQIIGMNLTLAGVLLCVFQYFRDKSDISDFFKTQGLKLHILRGVLNFIISVMFIFALIKLQMATVYTLVFITPFCAVLITAFLYGEQMQLRRWLCILGGFLGILCVIRPFDLELDLMMLAPLGVAFLSALMFVVSKSLKTESNFKMGVYPSLIAGLLAIPFAIEGFQIPEISHIPLILVSAIGINIGVICVSRAYTLAPSAVVSPFHYSQILWALLFGYVFFSETPDAMTLIGAMIIIGSGLMLVKFEKSS